jgi:alpha-tubulin suppressor-like RCC1 family protein
MISDGTWKIVTSGDNHTCGTKTDNILWCWGWNLSGQLGEYTHTDRLTPARTSGNTFGRVIVPAITPSNPTSLFITGKTGTTASLSWTAGDNGGQPVTD